MRHEPSETDGPRRGVSFRARVAALIVAVFLAAGALLITALYLVVSGLLQQAIGTTSATVAMEPATVSYLVVTPTVGGVTAAGQAFPAMPMEMAGVATPAVESVSINGAQVSTWYADQSSVLADDVLVGLVTWSVVVLLVVAALVAVAAWWLARRSVRRLAEMTAMAQNLSHRDLSRRLDLAGPHDEIKQLADTFDAMLDRLQDSFERQERFVANASHELRTPLTTARTALEIPLAQGRVSAELEPSVRTALRAGDRSARIVTALLTLARAETIRDPLPCDLGDLTLEALAELRPAHPELTWEVDVASAPVVGDAVLLTQAITNLITNAVRYNVPDGRVMVQVTAANGQATVQVANTGAVVPAAEVGLLIEPFVRANGTRIAGPDHGTGLGLSIVDAVVKAHDGVLTVTARPTGGLDVTVDLPSSVVAGPAGPEKAPVWSVWS